MARVLKHPEWYEQVSPATLSESELEQKVILYAPYAYPDYYVIPFKKTVYSSYGPAKPDLAFIAKDYNDWLVVEVEMTYHSLKDHVEPQVEKLANANYDHSVVDYLCKFEPKLDYKRTLNLLQYHAVKVLLILNEPKTEWAKILDKYDASIAVFELFRSESYEEIYRINGEYPSSIIASISDCFFHPYITVLGVQDPSALSIKPGDKIKLRYENCITYWERNDDPGGNVWLIPTGRNPLNPRKRYKIVRLRDNTLVLSH